MSPRGGVRTGAGRPRLDPDVEKPPKQTVSLPPDLQKFAKDFGDNNFSEGVRRALELARDITETEEESD